MKASELRIGNLLQDREGRVCKVEKLNGKYFEIDAPAIKGAITSLPNSPIPLTEEWHLKFGGKDISSPPHNMKFSYDIKGTTLEVNYDRTKELWWFQYRNPFLIKDMLISLPREIKYVHEFQNFYKEFTGNELKI